MNEIKQFTFFKNYYDVIKELPNKEEFAFSILEYVFENKEPNFNGLNKGIWQLIQRPLEISKHKSNNAKKEIKTKSNQNQMKIKSKSNENQSRYSISTSSSISNSISKKEKDIRGMGEEEKGKEKISKKKFGEYQNVLLTKKEYESLQTAYSNYEELIKFLDEYIEDKGYKSKSHYLSIKRWVVGAVKEKNEKQKEENISDWFSQNLENEEMTEEEKKELDEVLKSLGG